MLNLRVPGFVNGVVTDLNTCTTTQLILGCAEDAASYQPERVVYDGGRKQFLILAWCAVDIIDSLSDLFAGIQAD